MKRFLISLSLLTPISSSAAAIDCCQPLDYSFYIKVDSGFSFSQCARVCAPNPPWNSALQGYDAKLGNRPITGLSIGCELADMLDLEVSVSNRSTFHYKKFQTPAIGGASYTRRFDLDVTSFLFSAALLANGIPCLSREISCGKIYPMIGTSLGVSKLLITNFRTTGLPPSGDSSPYASFSAENQYTLRKNFTYALLAGLEYNHNNSWALSTGYRWFNVGRFEGPRYQRVANGSAVDVACDTWKMRFSANEWFVEFKIFI